MSGGAESQMVELIVQVTLVILILAALVFVFQAVRQKRAGQLSASSFSMLLLVVIIGWLMTEVVSDATGAALGELGRITHFAVMILFAATLTLQFRRSSTA